MQFVDVECEHGLTFIFCDKSDIFILFYSLSLSPVKSHKNKMTCQLQWGREGILVCTSLESRIKQLLEVNDNVKSTLNLIVT